MDSCGHLMMGVLLVAAPRICRPPLASKYKVTFVRALRMDL